MNNANEECLIKYLSIGKYEQQKTTVSLINFLLNHNIKIKFDELNPVCNIIDELEFLDEIMYN